MKTLPLGDVVDFIGGGTPSKRVAAYYGGDIPWATVRDMNVDLLSKTDHSITLEGLANSSSKVVPKGEVIIASRVGLGKVCILEQDTAINQDLRGLIPKSDKKLDRKFLFYWYQSVANTVIGAGSGATVQGVKLTFLRTLPIWLPPLEEQRCIVAVMDEAFAALDRARENVEANLTEVDNVVRSALDKIVAKNATDMPSMKLKEITHRLTNGYVGATRDIYQDDGIPYLLARHVKNNRLNFDGKTFVTPAFNEKHKKSKLKTDDVVLVQSGHIGHCAVIDKSHDGHNCHAMIVLTTDKKILTGEYLATVFATGEFKEKFQEIRTGSTVPHLTCKLVKELDIPLMSKQHQSEITESFASLQEMTASMTTQYLSKLQDIDDLRQSLLQRAFAGELMQAASKIALNDNDRDARFSAAVLVLAYDKHLVDQRQNTFGHVKAAKALHLTESIAGLDLGRQPKVRQAGPHDQDHFARVEAWASEHEAFRFEKRRSGGYTFKRGARYDDKLAEAKTLLADHAVGLSKFMPLMVDMSTDAAEVFTTVHAAWNNLLADGKTPSDDEIIYAAREGWHESKTSIARSKFSEAIRLIRRNDLEPDGSAKYVHGAQTSLI